MNAVDRFTNTITVKKLAWMAFCSGGLSAICYEGNHKTGGATFTADFETLDGATRFGRKINAYSVEPIFKIVPIGYSIEVPAPRPYTRLPEHAGMLIHITDAENLAYKLFSTGLGTIQARRRMQ